MRRILLIGGVGMISGCASIVEGTSQNVAVDVTPEAADCSGTRDGKPVGTFDPKTRLYHVDKSKDDISFTCTAAGYKPKTIPLVSSASAWGVVGAFTLDFGITDYATGALNKYQPTVTIVLEKAEAAPS